MKAKMKFMSGVLVLDTFLVAFCVGFNSHPVLVVDESLPAYKPPVTENSRDSDAENSPAKAGADGGKSEKSADAKAGKAAPGNQKSASSHAGAETTNHSAGGKSVGNHSKSAHHGKKPA